MSTDITNLFNDATALFPILLLSKTVSFRNRTHDSWELVVHGTHVAAMFAGEAIALWGAWAASTKNLAGCVIGLLAYGAITFALDVICAARKDNAAGMHSAVISTAPSSQPDSPKGTDVNGA